MTSSPRPGSEERAQAGDLLAELHSLPEDSPRRKSLRDQLVAHPAGFAVTLYPACNRSKYECEVTFGNLGNYGGSFGIPTENPTNKV